MVIHNHIADLTLTILKKKGLDESYLNQKSADFEKLDKYESLMKSVSMLDREGLESFAARLNTTPTFLKEVAEFLYNSV
jgi:hypothetical protein